MDIEAIEEEKWRHARGNFLPIDTPKLALWLGLVALVLGSALEAQNLPDTGQDTCYDGANMVACTGANTGDASSHPRQDGRYGRDPAFAQGAFSKTGGGQKGFDYTKLDGSGNALSIQNAAWAASGGYDSGSEAAGTKWSCVTDNTTGLTWEVKTKQATPGLRDSVNTYTWYSTNASNNSGNAGSAGSNTCNGTLSGYGNQCNTQNYVAAINAAQLCGFSDWRLPSYRELPTLVHAGTHNPSIDAGYFPNTQSYWFWSASSYAPYQSSAWLVDFSTGDLGNNVKGLARYLRVVRGAPF